MFEPLYRTQHHLSGQIRFCASIISCWCIAHHSDLRDLRVTGSDPSGNFCFFRDFRTTIESTQQPINFLELFPVQGKSGARLSSRVNLHSFHKAFAILPGKISLLHHNSVRRHQTEAQSRHRNVQDGVGIGSESSL